MNNIQLWKYYRKSFWIHWVIALFFGLGISGLAIALTYEKPPHIVNWVMVVILGLYLFCGGALFLIKADQYYTVWQYHHKRFNSA